MASDDLKVHLGTRDYSLVPQRIGRLRRKFSAIGAVMQEVAEGDAAKVAEGASTQVYDALRVFIPDLVPEWKFWGYDSEATFKAKGEHDAKLAAEREAFAEKLGDGKPWAELVPEQREGFKPKTKPFVEPDDDNADESPTPPEIADALEQILTVHGGDRLVRLLKNVLGPDLIRAMLRESVAAWASARSPSSPATNGDSPSTSSTTMGLTPATPASSGSPSPDS